MKLFYPVTFCVCVSSWVTGLAMDPHPEPIPRDPFVAQVLRTHWQGARKVRRVGLEVEMRDFAQGNVEAATTYIGQHFGGSLRLLNHHFISHDTFTLKEIMEFYCQYPEESPKVYLKAAITQTLGLHSKPMPENATYQIDVIDIYENPIASSPPLGPQAAWRWAQNQCSKELALRHQEATPVSPKDLAATLLGWGGSTTQLNREEQKPFQLYPYKRHLTLPVELTTLPTSLETIKVVFGEVAPPFAQWPKPLWFEVTHGPIFYAPTYHQKPQWGHQTAFAPKAAHYQYIQKALATGANFSLRPNSQYHELDNTPLGTLRLSMDGSNVELATEPRLPDKDFFLGLNHLLQVLYQGGYFGMERKAGFVETGLHVNVEILPQERRNLSFVKPLIQDWQTHRSSLFSVFRPSPSRSFYYGEVPVTQIDAMVAIANSGATTPWGYQFGRFYDVNARPFLMYCQAENLPTAGEGNVWPRGDLRPAIEYRIFDMDFSPQGLNRFFLAVAFGVAFTHKWAGGAIPPPPMGG